MIDVDDAREKVQFGRERRRLMDDEEKKLTAYHEAGHALVQAVLDDGHMPVHKVTIIPRGRSLGSTMFIPKKDILTHAKKRMEPDCHGAGRPHRRGARARRYFQRRGRRHQADHQDRPPHGLRLGHEPARPDRLRRSTTTPCSWAAKSRATRTILRGDRAQDRRGDSSASSTSSTSGRRRSSRAPAALDKMAEALLEHETIDGKHVLEILSTGKSVRRSSPCMPPKV
jgi:cell division protease FtsH